jgi:hypothetical protein
MNTGRDQDGSNLANERFDIEEVEEALEADEKADVGEEERDVEYCCVVGPDKPFEIRERTGVRNWLYILWGD